MVVVLLTIDTRARRMPNCEKKHWQNSTMCTDYHEWKWRENCHWRGLEWG